jgi:hypothetical protein
MKAEFMSIMSFETLDNSCVQGLHKQCHIGFKVEELDIPRFILNVVPREVVKGKTDALVLIMHLDV